MCVRKYELYNQNDCSPAICEQFSSNMYANLSYESN